MSTTFGIIVTSYMIDEDEEIEVARRTGVGKGKAYVRFTNALAHLLPDDTKVEALDNSPQGIYTIGDIKKEIEE